MGQNWLERNCCSGECRCPQAVRPSAMPEAVAASDQNLTRGCVVICRSHRWLVEEVEPSELPGGDTVVRMACLDDDANGQRLEVFWEREVDAHVEGQTTWDTLGQRGFDDPQVFGSYLNTLRWNCVTSTDQGLFQSPLRAGIDVKPYQLEPLRKALRMPRVSLFIADDVGLGKTIEAGLIMRELLLRQKVHRVVVVAPPSVVLQWKGEMESRFGLGFAVMDRNYISDMRRQRDWGINPWATHTRFIAPGLHRCPGVQPEPMGGCGTARASGTPADRQGCGSEDQGDRPLWAHRGRDLQQWPQHQPGPGRLRCSLRVLAVHPRLRSQHLQPPGN